MSSECRSDALDPPKDPIVAALPIGFREVVEPNGAIEDIGFKLLPVRWLSSLAFPFFPGVVSGKTLAALRPLIASLILDSRSSSLPLSSCPIEPGAALFARLKPILVFGLDGAGIFNFSSAIDRLLRVDVGGGCEALLRSNVGNLPVVANVRC